MSDPNQNNNAKVQDACDEIWNCQQPEEAIPWLKSLHQGLLTEPVSAYDPSEAFLAIQGAALRFGSQPQQQQQQQQQASQQQEHTPQSEELNNKNANKNAKTNDDDQEQEKNITKSSEKTASNDNINNNNINDAEKRTRWLISQECSWAAAALACVCVGPAWRYQLHHRRTKLANRGRLNSAVSINQDDYSSSAQSTSGMDLTNADISVPGTVRSFSPITTSTFGNSGATPESFFPPIPEVLPGAMLRFAASFIGTAVPNPKDLSSSSSSSSSSEQSMRRQKSLAVAQRYLVLALCCESPNKKRYNITENSPKSVDWTIPGAHDAVGRMLSFWLQVTKYTSSKPPVSMSGGSITSSETHNESSVSIPSDGKSGKVYIDWWYNMEVARASTDLVSTGWRPLPGANIGEEVVQSLIEMAEKGIVLLHNEPDPLNVTRDAREELLAASSSAAESISALATLGSRGFIPQTSQHCTARALCQLHVISGAVKSCIHGSLHVQDNLSIEEKEVVLHDRKVLMTQIESCFADTADFLWVLLATQSSASSAISTLLSTVTAASLNANNCKLREGNDDEDDNENDNNRKSAVKNWDYKKKLICMEAGTAVRMVSAALWGRPPDVLGIPHLRIYWTTLLETILDIASGVHQEIQKNLQECDDIRIYLLSQATHDMLSLALDTVVALGRLIDRELVGGTGLVSIAEWDIFVSGLETSIVPWIQYITNLDLIVSSVNINSSDNGSVEESDKIIFGIFERAKLEIVSLMLRIGEFFDKCLRLESSPLHSTMEYGCQKKLYLIMLRKFIPHMYKTNAKIVGISTFRAWTKFGLLPYHYENLLKTVSEIIIEAFAVYDDGSFIHAPRVQYEALRPLASGERYSQYSPTNNADNNIPTDSSLLAMTRYLGDVHSNLVNDCIIPVLQSVLRLASSKLEDQLVLPKPIPTLVTARDRERQQQQQQQQKNPVDNRTLSSKISNVLLLERFAVRVLGGLVRSDTTDTHRRESLVDIIRNVALYEHWDQDTIDTIQSIENDAKNVNVISFFDRQAVPSVRLEALEELELCLSSPFHDLPHTHEVIPAIIDSLSKILRKCVKIESAENMSKEAFELRLSIASAAVVAMSRLQLYDGSKLAILPRQCVVTRFPIELQRMLPRGSGQANYNNTNNDRSSPDLYTLAVAPFIRVIDNNRKDDEKDNNSAAGNQNNSIVTLFSFQAIVQAIAGALVCTKCEVLSKSVRYVDSQCLQTLRCLCYSALSTLTLSGLDIVPFLVGSIGLAEFGSNEQDNEMIEATYKNKLLVLLGQSIAAGTLSSSSSSCNEDTWPNALSIIIGHILDACDPSISSDVIGGSRSMCALMASLENSNIVSSLSKEHQGTQVLTQILERCISCLQLEIEKWNQSLFNVVTTAETEDKEGDIDTNQLQPQPQTDDPQTQRNDRAVVALLTILYESFIGFGINDQVYNKYYIDLFQICQNIFVMAISHSPNYLLNLSIRFMTAIICQISDETAKVILEKINVATAKGSNEKLPQKSVASEPEQVFLSTIVLELLEQKLQTTMEIASSTQDDTSRKISDEKKESSGIMIHEQFATEIENIESFEVEKSDNQWYGKSKVAWLVGDCNVLTFRIGSFTSRFRGWVEIILRTPTIRKRVMVRMPTNFALSEPERFSGLWSGRLNPLEPLSKTGNVAATTAATATIASNDDDQSDIMDTAKKLMSRFDSVCLAMPLEEQKVPSKTNTQPLNSIDIAQSLMARFDSMVISQNPDDDGGSTVDMPNQNNIFVDRSLDLSCHDDASRAGTASVTMSSRLTGGDNPLGPRVSTRQQLSSHGSQDKSVSAGSEDVGPPPATTPTIDGWLTDVFGPNINDLDNVVEVLHNLHPTIYSSSDALLDPSPPDDGSKLIECRLPIQYLKESPKLDRAIAVLDRTIPSMTHKVALLYTGPRRVGKGNTDIETMLLNTVQASPEFHTFSEGLGDMVLNEHLRYFSGGLDVSKYHADGRFTRAWIGGKNCAGEKASSNHQTQPASLSIVIYHVVSLMPDVLNNRKRHVGNDNVLIVFVDRGSPLVVDEQFEEENIQDPIISGHFGFVTIYVIQLPRRPGLVRICVKIRQGLNNSVLRNELLALAGNDIVAFEKAPQFVRNVAMRADLVCRSLLENLAPPFNCLERYKILNGMSRYVAKVR